ncbi:MAG: hypothetical protein WCJ02_16095 [bacterium]
MKTLYRYWVLLLLLGCGAEAPRQPDRRIYYPALNESPPPPSPELPPCSEAQPDMIPNRPATTPSIITSDRWIDRMDEHEKLIKSLREYSAKAAPGDPFALTEKEIIELSKREDVRIN